MQALEKILQTLFKIVSESASFMIKKETEKLLKYFARKKIVQKG